MKRVMATFALGLAACGNAGAPEISNLVLTRDLVNRGEEFFAQFHAEDEEGNFANGSITVRAILVESSNDEELELEEQLPVDEVPFGAKKADPILGLTFDGDIVIGNYRLEIELADEEGAVSDILEGRIGCNDPNRPIIAALQ